MKTIYSLYGDKDVSKIQEGLIIVKDTSSVLIDKLSFSLLKKTSSKDWLIHAVYHLT